MIKWATSGFYGQLVSLRVGFSSLRGPDEKITPLAPLVPITRVRRRCPSLTQPTREAPTIQPRRRRQCIKNADWRSRSYPRDRRPLTHRISGDPLSQTWAPMN